jgi:hypothetical protein
MYQKHKKNKYIILNLALRFTKLRNKQKVMLILKQITFLSKETCNWSPLVWILPCRGQQCHNQVQNALFITPTKAGNATELSNSFRSSMGFGNTHQWPKAAFVSHFLLATCVTLLTIINDSLTLAMLPYCQTMHRNRSWNYSKSHILVSVCWASMFAPLLCSEPLVQTKCLRI